MLEIGVLDFIGAFTLDPILASSLLAHESEVHQHKVHNWDDRKYADLDKRRCWATRRPHLEANPTHSGENDDDANIPRH
jgi:hypothetical protein